LTKRSQFGVVLFAHGSRLEPANQAVRSVARELARTGGYPCVEAAFLELGQPDLATAIARLTASGSRRIVVLPYFLTLGLHMERDLPRLISDISKLHNGLEIIVAPALDGHPALVEVLLDRAQAALNKT
jgi:sirohydrochlorin ferrochelatase